MAGGKEKKHELIQQNMSGIKKYLTTKEIPIREIRDRKLKSKLKKNAEKSKDIAFAALQSEILLNDSGYLEEEGLEKSFKITQDQLTSHLDINTLAKRFDLDLDFGDYSLNYSPNGSHLLFGGAKGHLAAISKKKELTFELHVRETIKDVHWLHNDTMLAVAQKKYTYIYDKTGMELHCLRDHIEANKIGFLPYHFLLTTVGNAGYLKYQDISTGQLVSQHRSRLGKCNALAVSNYNSIVHLGHANGTVTLWSPSMQQPLVKMLCHPALILDLSIDPSGMYMATTGIDNQFRIWDLRTYRQLNAYFTATPANHCEFSQSGLLAIGSTYEVQVWKDVTKKQKTPYMTHRSKCSGLSFQPFEDVLAIGHSGISTIIIPGSGEINFDTMELNPFQTTKQRQETEVHMLLDKIPADMITLDPSFVGKVDRVHDEVIAEERQAVLLSAGIAKKDIRKRARGKSSSQRRYLRKQGNVVDEKREVFKEKLEKIKKERDVERKKERGEFVAPPRTALDRFK